MQPNRLCYLPHTCWFAPGTETSGVRTVWACAKWVQGHRWLEEEVSTATAAVPWGGKQGMQEHMRLPPCST